jgi:hypothetical protein
MEQSIMPPEFSGAYVSCYAKGNDYIEATEKSLKKLSVDGLYPEEILQPIQEMDSEFWSAHVSEKWEEYAKTMLTQAEFEKALEKDKVIYGPFGSYK